ncbi:HAD-IA family hydrolase [Bradyrhizobium sp. Leo121]|uniref:HAD-IA family hydrolase n=1 Tax=Bradyrhizobium sp. Leo121 TaxID=1571195 RepID=UPI001028C3F7|nr:HAD-IA family hydrolase [Bradyrhizobium sp. Leo121]RZN33578.1 beta-phosphoglucomutase family hydrolase [Bradyrhizobium sp. Leo121]
MSRKAGLVPSQFDAVAFDLDGVVTDTARIHFQAWTQTFDVFFEGYTRRTGVAFAPFTLEDYRKYIDGRPREEAIRAFLAARGVGLAEGDERDGPEVETIQGLAVRKDGLFLDRMRGKGVDVYPSTVALIRRLRALGLKTAVVSASRNCQEILQTARLDHLFDARIDGRDAATLGLPGKPAPDTFLAAAQRLGSLPDRTVVIEDAIAGVAAGRAGGFGLVIGIDRVGHGADLKNAGADIVVADLNQIDLELDDRVTPRPLVAKPDVHRLDPFIAQQGTETRHPAARARPDPWLFVHEGFDPALEGRRETLFAVGNGYFVTRGAAAEARADDLYYPGTYLAGGYNRLTTMIDGRPIENEDLVNLPNWLPLTFRIDDGDWFDLRRVEVLEYQQTLDLRHGLYLRSLRVRDPLGREINLTERRFVHMDSKHLAGQHVTVTSQNWSGRLTVRAMLDGDVANTGVPRYKAFESRNLRVCEAAAFAPCSMLLQVEMTQSQLRIAQAARLDVRARGLDAAVHKHPIEEAARVGYDIALDAVPGAGIEIEKIVALYTSRDRAIADPETAARTAIARADSFDALLQTHRRVWGHLWERCDLDLLDIASDEADETHLAVRLHLFHLLQTASSHSMELDAGIPARGWHGEGYRGHIFWDELFIFPLLNLHFPILARALLLYRYRRLDEARWAARQAGFRGAMYPWQSGSDGREETDVMYFNPRSGNWIKDDTHLQRHIGAAVAYNVWQYHQATGDAEFLYSFGAELMFEIARFWASLAQWNEARDRYDIRGVMGPDEFHDGYPDRDEAGLDNNAYTNVMAVWCIARALDLFELLPKERCHELCQNLRIEQEELAHWEHVSCKLYLPFHDDGILSQFEGYELLQEFDWDAYRRKYPNIMRLDLILEAESDSPNRYKLSKQADALMLFYLFSAEELAELFNRLGYTFNPATIPRTIDYYLRRSSHGSTLSALVHAWVLARCCRQRSWSLFTEALQSDISDVQGGTTREGIHLGAMSGTIDLLQRCFTGLELRGEELHFHPTLPDELRRLAFRLRYRQHSLSVDITQDALTLASDPSGADAISIAVDERHFVLYPGERTSVPLHRAS